MPDSFPGLTSSLKQYREQLLAKRKGLVSNLEEIRAAVERITVQIEAADTLIISEDPNHVAIDLRGEEGPAPIVVQQRPLRLAATQQEAAIQTEPAADNDETTVSQDVVLEETEADSAVEDAAPEAEEPEATVVADENSAEVAPTSRSTAPGKRKNRKTETAEVKAPEPEPEPKPRKTKAPSAAARQLINDYFTKTNRNEVVLDILARAEEPIRAPSIASQYREVHPLDPDEKDAMDVKGLLSARIFSTLYLMEARGHVVRTEQEVPGKNPELYWSIDPVFKGQREKEQSKVKKASMKKKGSKPKAENTAEEQPAPEPVADTDG